MAGARDIGVEPALWYLCFQRGVSPWWARLLAWGRFDHVLALGWIADLRVWVIYDVSLGETSIRVLPDSPGGQLMMSRLIDASVVVSVPRVFRVMKFRPGFWCAPAMAHLVGLPFCFRPDALYRLALRHGGVEV